MIRGIMIIRKVVDGDRQINFIKPGGLLSRGVIVLTHILPQLNSNTLYSDELDYNVLNILLSAKPKDRLSFYFDPEGVSDEEIIKKMKTYLLLR